MKEYEPIVIICPQCHRRVGKYEGRATINPKFKCKECKQLVTYNINSGKVELGKVPERMYGSGMRFY